jgi:hypothetical protein
VVEPMQSTAECDRCLDTGWCMEDPRQEFQTDQAIPCPLCCPEAHAARLRGERYWEAV